MIPRSSRRPRWRSPDPGTGYRRARPNRRRSRPEGKRSTVCLATWLESTWGRRTARWPSRRPARRGPNSPDRSRACRSRRSWRSTTWRNGPSCRRSSTCRRPRNSPRVDWICLGSRRRSGSWASSRAIRERRSRAGWSARPRAGSRMPESIAGRPSCPGPRRRMCRGSRPLPRRRPTSNICAMPGTTASPASPRRIAWRIRTSS